MKVEAIRGDITAEQVDTIVNAANGALRRGAGVCGAIYAAAGPDLDAACAAIGGCATGDAVVTPGFALAARWIIHAARCKAAACRGRAIEDSQGFLIARADFPQILGVS